MLDAAIQPLQRRALNPIARRMVARGARADNVTLTGFVLGIVAMQLVMQQLYLAALAFILLNRL